MDELSQADERIVARLRSALDELTSDVEDINALDAVADVSRATGVGEATEGFVPVRAVTARPDRRRAWLGAAAATVLLAGGAVWALSTRTEDPVASPDEPRPTPLTDDASAGSEPTSVSSPTSMPDGAASYAISSARLAPGPQRIDVAEVAEVAEDAFAQFLTFRVDGEGLDGFLFVTVADELAVSDDAETTPLDVPTGDAQLVWPLTAPDEAAVPWIRWERTDGAVWSIQQQGLYSAVASNGWIDLALLAEAGSGLPVVIPDERAALVALGGPSTTVRTQAYTSVDTGTVDLTVTDGGAALFALVAATDVREVTVAGSAGWLGTYDDGHVEVVWDAGGGWWGLLGISPELADQADDIVSSVVRTDSASEGPAPTVSVPDNVQLYRTTGQLIQTGTGPTMIAYGFRSSLPPQGGNVEIVGIDLSGLLDVRTLSGTTWTEGTYELIGTFDEELFTFVGPLLPAMANEPAATLPPPTPSCDQAEVQPTVDAIGGLDGVDLGVLSVGPDTTEGHCGVVVTAVFDTPELRAALTPWADQVRVEFAITPL